MDNWIVLALICDGALVIVASMLTGEQTLYSRDEFLQKFTFVRLASQHEAR